MYPKMAHKMFSQANTSPILPVRVKQLAHTICRLEQSVAIYIETLHHDAVGLSYNFSL